MDYRESRFTFYQVDIFLTQHRLLKITIFVPPHWLAHSHKSGDCLSVDLFLDILFYWFICYPCANITINVIECVIV